MKLRKLVNLIAKFKVKGVKLAYLSYPYSDNPRQRTKEAVKIAQKIMKKHPEIFVIVPHTAVDYTMFGEIPEKLTDHNQEDHFAAPIMEFIILSKIGLFIIGRPLDVTVSTGMIWEWAFCRWRQLKGDSVKIISAEEMM